MSGSLDRTGVAPGEVRILDAPGDDPLGVDSDPRPLPLDGLCAAPDLDAARLPRIDAGQLVDHDRRPPPAPDVPELLGVGDVDAAHVDRLQLAVEPPADGDD